MDSSAKVIPSVQERPLNDNGSIEEVGLVKALGFPLLVFVASMVTIDLFILLGPPSSLPVPSISSLASFMLGVVILLFFSTIFYAWSYILVVRRYPKLRMASMVVAFLILTWFWAVILNPPRVIM
ncbi:MAG: hypothetical protein ACW99U_13210 [Candidatus Thorarchaeota archaeon]